MQILRLALMMTFASTFPAYAAHGEVIGHFLGIVLAYLIAVVELFQIKTSKGRKFAAVLSLILGLGLIYYLWIIPSGESKWYDVVVAVLAMVISIGVQLRRSDPPRN